MKALGRLLLVFLASALPPVTGHLLRGRNVTTAKVVRKVVAPHAHVATNSSSRQVPSRQPRVYFLFLAVDKVSNLDVWKAFFATANPDQYRAFIHCKLPGCISFVAGSPLVAVPTVPSYYCTDLVSPMNQLLAYALHSDAGLPSNPADKFAFVSDSSLPAKPFHYIYSVYSSRQGSDFCVFPTNEWADNPSASGLEMVPKAHQWITLSRAHAERASSVWAGGTFHDFMTRFHMNANQYTWSDNSFGDSRNFGCLDEFWYMAAIYGPLTNINAHVHQVVPLSLFTGGPLQVSNALGWQGECSTFVVWSKYLHAAGRNPFSKLHSSLDQYSIPHGGNHARPGWWDTITSTGISAIRQSSFLFVRKFIDNPRLASGGAFGPEYIRLIVNS